MAKNLLKWDDLRVFLHVAREGRLLAAGRSLAIDPATVGRRISALERALGAKLFDRSPQGYALTDAGANLIAHAQSMESLAASARDDVGGSSEQLTGTVRIGAPDGVANFLLPDATKSIVAAHPALKLQVVALPRLFSLSKREADLAIAVSPPTAGRLRVRKIGDYRLRLYGGAELVQGLGNPKRRRDLKGVPQIGYIQDMIFDKELDYRHSLGEADEPDLSSNSLVVQLRWTLENCGLCILPDFVAAGFPGLAPVLPERFQLWRSFYLLRHQDDVRVARIQYAAEAVTTVLRERLAQLAKLP